MKDEVLETQQRIQVEDAAGLWLVFPAQGDAAQGGEIRARVLELSKCDLIVAVAVESVVLEGGTSLRATLASSAGDRASRSLGLVVCETLDEAAGLRCVRLKAADERAAAALWLTMTEVAMGESARLHGPPPQTLERVPGRGIYTEQSRLERLDWLRAQTGTALDTLQQTTLQPERLTGNIENLIGSVEIPVGLAGPLWIRGEKARGKFFMPFATTEGALVASATRGATAITRSGGVATRVLEQRMMRVPLFVFSHMNGAYLFTRWVRDHAEELAEQTRQVSRHANLQKVEPLLVGNMVHVRFVYSTGDAAGQNMTTSCTWHACQWLLEQIRGFDEIQLENFIIEANLSGDKKVTYQSFLQGRGTRVTAACALDRETLEKVLKVTPDHLARVNQDAMVGSQHAGMIGYNIDVANVLAAVFAATGQDIACVHESSLAQFTLQHEKDGVYASMTLPALIIGTVGGGTHLPRQNELLEMMGCAGPGKVSKLAEIIAGYCLALDLSTLAAVASGQFASAHERLGRNRPVDWFRIEDLAPQFFEAGLRDALGEPELVCESVEPIAGVQMGSSILTELTARNVQKLVGHFPLRLETRAEPDAETTTTEVVAKVKPLDQEVILMTNTMASMCAPRLAAAYAKFKDHTGFAGCHTRELDVYEQTDERFTRIAPKLYGTFRSEEREAWVLVLERLQGLELMDSADDVSGWTPEHIEAAIRGIADFHAIWYGREDELTAQPWLVEWPTCESMSRMSELWEALGVHAREEFPEWVSDAALSLHRMLVRNVPDWWAQIESLPRTLIHNDFNPRNIAMRRTAAGDLQLCAYDWELATLHLPQHDLAELLCFVLSPKATLEEVDHYVEVHRQALEHATGRTIDRGDWHAGYELSLFDLTINRMALYVMAHTFRDYRFLERVIRTLRHLIRLERSPMAGVPD